MKRLVVAALALTTLSGCATLLELLRTAQSAFQQPTFVFKNVALTELSLGGMNLDTVWELGNPNDVSLSLASIDYTLLIDGKQVVSGAPPQGLQVAARGATQLHFPAAIKFVDLAQVVETFLTKDTATWRVQGSIGVQTPIGVLSLPLAQEGLFDVPKIPAVAFGDPKVTNLSLMGATLEFPLRVTNKNSFPLPVSGVVGNLTVAGSTLGTISTGDLGALEGQGTKMISIPLNVSFLSAAGAVVNAIRGGNAQVSFNAQLQSGAQAVPLKVDQLVNFIR